MTNESDMIYNLYGRLVQFVGSSKDLSHILQRKRQLYKQ